MQKATVNERLADISARCGLSESMVRRVLIAEKESIVDSLKKGQKATLVGRCTIEPVIRRKLGLDRSIVQSIKLKCTPAISLESDFNDMTEFVEDKSVEEKLPAGVLTRQIANLQ